MNYPPRCIRLRDAPEYLGMDRNRFNAEVRPYLVEIPIGRQGVGFDRLDLDSWFDQYKDRNGRPAKQEGGKEPWRKEKPGVYSGEAVSGISTRKSGAAEFAKALEKATSREPKNT